MAFFVELTNRRALKKLESFNNTSFMLRTIPCLCYSVSLVEVDE